MTQESATTFKKMPKHVAIIMDGNRRWARSKKLPTKLGHKSGADTVERIVRHAANIGVQYITLFGFSTENWKRSDNEISDLTGLLKMYLNSKTSDMHKNNVRLCVLGDYGRFPEDIVQMIKQAEDLTKDNTGIQVNMALSYSGRWDITQACQAIAQDVVNNKLSADDISEDILAQYLSTGQETPDVDLLIRTSGELRISNFTLWQAAYAEMYFCDTLWPDFSEEDLNKAIHDYAQRDRRFGGEAQDKAQSL